MQQAGNLKRMKMLMTKDKMNLILLIMKTLLATNLFDQVNADGANLKDVSSGRSYPADNPFRS